jgi:demethoxyubiquinone hydroxylase (CLK1/Coq7/Cat5 family)
MLKVTGDNYHKIQLIRTLQSAYSGEKAAGYAYNGHWRTLKNPEQRSQVQKIEYEEWEHRVLVGEMLAILGARPQLWRELMMVSIGRTLGLLCHLIGWFFPMYFAGRLESFNWKEYDVALFHANKLGLVDFEKHLMRLSQVETEHELFFARMVANHPLLPIIKLIFKWGPDSSTQLTIESPSETTKP